MNVDRTKIIIFSLGGACAALGGIFLACSIRSSDPNIGDSYTMMLVASCVVGGTALSGGKGSALGTVLGALAIAVIKRDWYMLATISILICRTLRSVSSFWS